MANKKINELVTRTPSLSDLMLVGDPSSGYSYKCTITSLATIIETDIADGYVTLTTAQTISGAKTFSNILTLTSVANATTDPDKFLVLNGSNVVNYRTGSEVLSDIGAQGALTLTTTGTSGAATLVGNTLNIPQYTDQYVGTVTSVAMSVPTGLSVSGSPITTSGTLAVSLQSGYSIPTTASQSNWDSAYNNMIVSAAVTGTTTKTLTLTQQDAGTITASWTDDNTDAVTSVFGRTGAVVATEGDYSLTQLSDVTITTPTNGQVLKYNGTTWVNDTDANTGTVTSVAMSVPTGLSVSGSPITSSGTLAVTFSSGYSIPTTASQSNWDTAYTNRITSLTTSGSSGAATLVSNTLNIPNYTLSGLGGEPAITAGTTSQYFRGDKTFQTLNTAAVTESTNLYYTNARARQAISLTTTGTSGAATYDNGTGVLNVPNYTLSGLGGVPTTRTLTINGTALDLSVDRSWSVGTVTSVAATAGTGISISGSPITSSGTLTITNTAPDQVVALTAGTGISTSGTYPNFTITNSAPDQTVSLTAGSNITITGTYPNFTIAALGDGTGTVTSVGLSSATSGVTIGSTPVTTSGTITLAIATASGSQQGLLSSTDWTTFNNKQNALTNPVTGTGTTNYIPKFTSSSAIGNSAITDVSGIIKIGTTASTTYGTLTIVQQSVAAPSFVRGIQLVHPNGTGATGGYFGISVSGQKQGQIQIGDDSSAGDLIINPAGGNLGLGVTPSAWISSFKAFQILNQASIAAEADLLAASVNGYYDGQWKYLSLIHI